MAYVPCANHLVKIPLPDGRFQALSPGHFTSGTVYLAYRIFLPTKSGVCYTDGRRPSTLFSKVIKEVLVIKHSRSSARRRHAPWSLLHKPRASP